jgi:uncharacterized protein YgbK (DUF1537 family)
VTSAAAVRLGVVADDVTGACDLAGRVAEAGLAAVVTIGVPATAEGLFPTHGDSVSGCAVIALKSRTAPVSEAVEASARSAERLLDAGATLLYQKYCSTFDSTAEGNIGPVGDALARVVDASAGSSVDAAITVGTPATPAAGRTQESGLLLIDGRPLAETPMRDHPLTPMRDSDVVRLLQAQTPAAVDLIPEAVVAGGPDAVAARIREAADSGARHLLADARDENDLDSIAQAILTVATDRRVVAAGAAGVATALARTAATPGGRSAIHLPAVPDGGRLILSGSASAATRAQNAAFDGVRITVDPHDLASDTADAIDRLKSVVATALAGPSPVLVTATTSSDEVARIQRELGAERAAQLVEQALGELAAHAVSELGVTRLIVAGGETSGAVVARLGVGRLSVGEQVAPGVPWTTGVATAAASKTVALLLKSGNFGDERLFTTAWETAP